MAVTTPDELFEIYKSATETNRSAVLGELVKSARRRDDEEEDRPSLLERAAIPLGLTGLAGGAALLHPASRKRILGLTYKVAPETSTQLSQWLARNFGSGAPGAGGVGGGGGSGAPGAGGVGGGEGSGASDPTQPGGPWFDGLTQLGDKAKNTAADAAPFAWGASFGAIPTARAMLANWDTRKIRSAAKELVRYGVDPDAAIDILGGYYTGKTRMHEALSQVESHLAKKKMSDSAVRKVIADLRKQKNIFPGTWVKAGPIERWSSGRAIERVTADMGSSKAKKPAIAARKFKPGRAALWSLLGLMTTGPALRYAGGDRGLDPELAQTLQM